MGMPPARTPPAPTRAVGSRMKRPTEKATPRITARVTKKPAAFSLPRRSSSHSSNLDGSSSSSSSSGKKEAEYMRAFTPLAMEEPKLKMPRIKGRPRMGCLSLMRTRSSTFSSSWPSGLRTTMARFSGPIIMMPSMSACPPIMVLKGVAQDLCSFDMGLCFSFCCLLYCIRPAA